MSAISFDNWGSLTGANESRRRGDGNQTGDSARAETDSGPLALQAVIPEHPGESTNGSGKVSDHTSRRCPDVRGKGTATVESKPAKPEENGSENNVGGIVGLVCKLLSPVTCALPKVNGDS